MLGTKNNTKAQNHYTKKLTSPTVPLPDTKVDAVEGGGKP